MASFVIEEGSTTKLSEETGCSDDDHDHIREDCTNDDIDGQKAESAQSQNEKDSKEETTSSRPDFDIGDHVYMWCSLLGIPNVFAHHGIVMDVLYDEKSTEWSLLIADFDNYWRHDPNPDNSCNEKTTQVDEGDEEGNGNTNTDNTHVPPAPERQSIFHSSSMSNSSRNNTGQEDEDVLPQSTDGSSQNKLRVYKANPNEWKKVEYGVGFWKQHLSRGGTVTKAQSDPTGLVIARVNFLLNLPSNKIPPYDFIKSNCECIAVWCKCGQFTTLQAAQLLHGMVAGHVKTTATVASAVATTQVTVPAAGIWGSWFGVTTQVSLLSTQPWLLPALIVGGTVAVGVPAVSLAIANKHWKATTEELNNAFWEVSADRPDLLVDVIQHYKEQNNKQSLPATTPIETHTRE